jgi:hypothetical protein
MIPESMLAGPIFRTVVTAAAGYIAIVNVASIVSSLIGFMMLRGVRPSITQPQARTLSISPMLPGISFLIDGRGPAREIFDQIDELMRMPYANFEVVAACEGVCVETVAALVERYQLLASTRANGREPHTGTKSTIFESAGENRLVIATGESKRAHMNSALAVSRMPLVGMVETDSMPTVEGLIALIRPFLDDRDAPPPASAGLTMIAAATATNGAQRMLHSGASIAEIIDRVGISTGAVAMGGFGAMLPAPGDLVLFDRSALMRSGGFDNPVGVDLIEAHVMTTYVRLIREARRDGTARTVFTPQVVATRTVPRSVVEQSRRRADRMLAELCVIRGNPGGVFSPAKGALGNIALPVMLLSGIITPGIELFGYIFTAVGLGLGVLGTPVAALYLLAAGGFGLLRALILVALALCRPVFAAEPISAASAVVWSILDVAGLRQAAACRFMSGLIVGSRRSAGRDSPDAGEESAAAQPISVEAAARNRIYESSLREPRQGADRAAHSASPDVNARPNRGGFRTQSE